MIATASAQTSNVTFPAGTALPQFAWLFDCLSNPANSASASTNQPECAANLMPGDYVVKCSRLGYEAQSAQFTVAAPPPQGVVAAVPVSVTVAVG